MMQANSFLIFLCIFFVCYFFTGSYALRMPSNRLISSSGLLPKTLSSSRTGSKVREVTSTSRLLAGARDADSNASKGPRQKKVKDDVIQVNGKVVESLPNAMFRVEIEPSKQIVLATVSGKIRKNMVRIIVGDAVQLELSAYDLTRGRIFYRNK